MWAHWTRPCNNSSKTIPTSVAFVCQIPACRAPTTHLAGPRVGPAGDQDLAQPADSGDLGAEGAQGAAGTGQEPRGERASTVVAGGRALPPAAEDVGEAGEWRSACAEGTLLQGRPAGPSNGSCSPVTHLERSQVPSYPSAKRSRKPSARQTISSLPGCQVLLLHSRVYVCKTLLFTRLFLRVVLHQTRWVPNLRWGTRLNRVNTER